MAHFIISFVLINLCLIAHIALCILSVTGCFRGSSLQTYGSHTFSNSTNDVKQNMKLRDQYYATVRKPSFSPDREISTLERIPEYSEDIYPYATFQLNEPAEARCTSGAPLQTFVYHDPSFTSAETLKIRESGNYPSVKNLLHKMKSLKSESEEYDESESESEHTISSRIESVSRSGHSFSRFHRNKLHKLVSKRENNFESSPAQKRKPPSQRSQLKGKKLSNAQLDPPSAFSDAHELSEAECDSFMCRRRIADFTIAV